MYYISYKDSKYVGITDTKDGVEDIYEYDALYKFKKLGVEILGVNFRENRVFVTPFTKDLIRLINSPSGTPVRVKLGKDSEFKQTVFANIIYEAGEYRFYFSEGAGMCNQYALRPQFVYENQDSILFDFDNNNPMEVARILKELNVTN